MIQDCTQWHKTLLFQIIFYQVPFTSHKLYNHDFPLLLRMESSFPLSACLKKETNIKKRSPSTIQYQRKFFPYFFFGVQGWYFKKRINRIKN